LDRATAFTQASDQTRDHICAGYLVRGHQRATTNSVRHHSQGPQPSGHNPHPGARGRYAGNREAIPDVQPQGGVFRQTTTRRDLRR
jgi:hypothetical protein